MLNTLKTERNDGSVTALCLYMVVCTWWCVRGGVYMVHVVVCTWWCVHGACARGGVHVAVFTWWFVHGGVFEYRIQLTTAVCS